eukprot:9679291-Heterocapsa_arctica.AAC.1
MIVKRGGFGNTSLGGARVLKLGPSESGAGGPYCIWVTRTAPQSAWAGVRTTPPQGTAWTYAELACGMGGFSHAAHRMGGGLTWACDISWSA